MRSGGETAAAVAGRRRGENGDHAILMFVFKVIRQRDIKWMYNFHNILDHTLYQIAMKRGLGARGRGIRLVSTQEILEYFRK